MPNHGKPRSTTPLSAHGINTSGAVHWNLHPARLVECEIISGRGKLAHNGALVVNTGAHTGRSPKDRYVVKDPNTENEIWWGDVNIPVEEPVFDALHREVCEYLADREIFVFEGFAGADRIQHIHVRTINEYGWQNLFCHQLFINPDPNDSEHAVFEPDWVVIDVPGYRTDAQAHGLRSSTFILINFHKRMVLIGGSAYAGEMKKSIFAVLNYMLPHSSVLPMHCSCNVGEAGDVAIFFGLSGTGKTTLSADPNRLLIGDDEHGWTQEGVFNFEGGCYAKTINLSQTMEPEIWDAIRFGAVLENVIMHENSRQLDYSDDSLTENTRAAYPLSNLTNAKLPSVAGHPRTILFLTCDAFGILPPITRLNPAQAMYYFISGYTAKIAGTERGITEPQATFSACFGAPFLPLHPTVYAELLSQKMKEHETTVWLVNTGWTGGAYGEGDRMRLDHTRAIVNAAIDGKLAESHFSLDPVFGFEIPDRCPGVPSEVLNPKNTWDDPAAYEERAHHLAGLFVTNFTQFEDRASVEIRKAAPRI